MDLGNFEKVGRCTGICMHISLSNLWSTRNCTILRYKKSRFFQINITSCSSGIFQYFLMFHEAEATYSSFLKCFCVHHQPHSIPVRKSDEMPSKIQPKPWSDRVFWSRFWLAFWGHFIGFTVDNIMWLVVNTKTRQKWRVRDLSFIKHQKLLKKSTWAWSCVDFKKVSFF